MIKIEKLSHIYNRGREEEVCALKDFNLEVGEGDFVALIGPNGSGKSTLARCLNAILIPSGGRVLVDGLDTVSLDTKWDIRQRVGIIFTNPENQLIGSTVEEDVAFGLENTGMDPSLMRRRVDEALRIVQMEECKDLPVHTLSGGQKQRVALAGILAFRPKYLILDEATALLDPGGRRGVMEVVQKLNKEEGMTILLITHSMEEVLLAGKVAVMNEGRKILEGGALEVFRRPELKELGLAPPVSLRLTECLRRGGLDIPEGATGIEQILEAVCP